MKKQKMRFLTLMVGLLVAAAVVCSNVFYSADRETDKTEIPVEKSTEEAPQDLTLNAGPTISFPSSSYVQLVLETYCLFAIGGTDDEKQFDLPELSFRAQEFLTTLFTVIISPNAP